MFDEVMVPVLYLASIMLLNIPPNDSRCDDKMLTLLFPEELDGVPLFSMLQILLSYFLPQLR